MADLSQGQTQDQGKPLDSRFLGQLRAATSSAGQPWRPGDRGALTKRDAIEYWTTFFDDFRNAGLSGPLPNISENYRTRGWTINWPPCVDDDRYREIIAPYNPLRYTLDGPDPEPRLAPRILFTEPSTRPRDVRRALESSRSGAQGSRNPVGDTGLPSPPGDLNGIVIPPPGNTQPPNNINITPNSSASRSSSSAARGASSSAAEGRSTASSSSQSGGPATGGPATGGPATGGPTTGGPATGGPATGGPATGGPATGGPTTGGPATGGPSTGGPATGGPATRWPATRGPATGGPATGGPTTGGPTTGGGTTGGATRNRANDNIWIADAQDCQGEHVFMGQRQPAKGIRLRHALNFLQDCDVDRTRFWETRFAELKAYINSIDESRIAEADRTIGPNTQLMIDEAKRRILVHEVYEKQNYGTFTENIIFEPDLIPKPKARLVPVADLPITLTGKPAVHWRRNLMPQTPLPKPEIPVNRTWTTEGTPLFDARRANLVLMTQDEDAWWQLPVTEAPDRDANLSFLENWTYEKCVNFNNGYNSGVYVDDTGRKMLFDNTEIGADPRSFAIERGARRAALQTALRHVGSMENQLATHSKWRRIVLPITAKEKYQATVDAGGFPGRKYDLKEMKLPQVPDMSVREQPDPQAYTVAWLKYKQDTQKLWDRARDIIIDKHGGGDGAREKEWWVAPPKQYTTPYIWRGVDAYTQEQQDLYTEMQVVHKLFERERKIAPRTLLDLMAKYYKQGIDGAARPDPHLALEDALTLMGGRDTDPRLVIRDLDMMEVKWLRFLMNRSIHQMWAQPLYPRDSLFLAFANRFDKIISDTSDTAAFPDLDTRITVLQLLDIMHKGIVDGAAVKRPKFFVYDAVKWLDRLMRAGRCRFTEDFKEHGWVMRAHVDVHPEFLVVYDKDRNDDDTDWDTHPEDMVYAPRFKELRTYDQVIKAGIPWNDSTQPVRDIIHYFSCLAFRWGLHMNRIKTATEPRWQAAAVLPHEGRMTRVLEEWKTEFDILNDPANGGQGTLQDLIRKTRPSEWKADLTDGAALKLVRDKIVDESMLNENMVYPGRKLHYVDRGNVPRSTLEHPGIWDFGKPSVRGKQKEFFTLDRWPVHFQTKDTQRRIRNEEDIDPQMVWDPVDEDPTEWIWHKPKARPYVDDKVKYKWGPRGYPAGDTPLQRKAVVDGITRMVGDAMQIDTVDDDNHHKPPSLLKRLSGIFSRSPQVDSSGLPEVHPSLTPKSVSTGELKRKREAEAEARRVKHAPATATAAAEAAAAGLPGVGGHPRADAPAGDDTAGPAPETTRGRTRRGRPGTVEDGQDSPMGGA